jgi:hypothetical protein
MAGSNMFHLRALALAVTALLSLTSAALEARPWKPTPQTQAQDYSSIVDNRGKGEIVSLKWFVPPVAPDSQNAQNLQALLDKYVVIGAVHAHTQPGGIMTFDAIDTLPVNDGGGTPLKALTGDDIPPTLAGYIVTLQGSLRQSMGATGLGIHVFAYDGGNVHACQKGGMSISFAGEVYTYDTPVPGCPQT